MAGRHAGNRLDAPWSIYEVHLGSWMREPAITARRSATARSASGWPSTPGRLGFTHVELMPVLEHPFYGSWGYQVTGYFAPTGRYGTPDDLMAMIDTLHQAGVGVIVDWVPAHFPTDAHGLGLFDGTHLYEHADPRRGFHPDWTSYIFNYGRHEVRAFLISSALCWLERFHVDALRVDGVASMLYRDYSRKPGEWVPDTDGSNHDRDAIGFLRQLQPRGLRAPPRRADDRRGVDRVGRRVAAGPTAAWASA
jgi:1,4-alpha-glucan branching enzyme